MKREIKFRVRDYDTKKILGYEMFNTVLNNGFCFFYTDDKEEILHSEFSTPPMIKPSSLTGQLLREQFTGLKDRNGVEIYEGDINSESEIVQWNNLHCAWMWFKNEYCVRELIADEYDTNGKPLKPWQAYEEIVGNIYENKSL